MRNRKDKEGSVGEKGKRAKEVRERREGREREVKKNPVDTDRDIEKVLQMNGKKS